MKILIGCEFSGIVRDAFIAKGHDAMSCDLLPTEKPGPHYQGNVLDIIDHGWDMMIAHPPCTYLCSSGARWWAGRQTEQAQAIEFFLNLWHSNIPIIAIENPVGIMSSKFRPPDQYIHPWQFGHEESKKTGLWLKGLPPLMPSLICGKWEAKVHKMSPSENRWKLRSITYSGIAEAMASQWCAV